MWRDKKPHVMENSSTFAVIPGQIDGSLRHLEYSKLVHFHPDNVLSKHYNKKSHLKLTSLSPVIPNPPSISSAVKRTKFASEYSKTFSTKSLDTIFPCIFPVSIVHFAFLGTGCLFESLRVDRTNTESSHGELSVYHNPLANLQVRSYILYLHRMVRPPRAWETSSSSSSMKLGDKTRCE